MIVQNGFEASERRSRLQRLAVCAAVMGAVLIAPALADAAMPWEYPGRDGLNRRSSNDAPPRYIGTVDRVGPAKAPAWKRTFDSEVTGTPVAARNGGVYVGDRGGVLHALVYSTGRTACATNVGALGTGSPPSPITGTPLYVHDKNTVYVVANKPGRPRLVAVNAINCDPLWSAELDNQLNWEASDPTYSPATNSIIVGTCVCTAEDNNASGIGGRGSVVSVNADSGALNWKTRTVSGPFNGGAVAGTPIPYDPLGRIFVATDHAFAGQIADPNTDAILALDMHTGQIVGSYQARQNDIASTATIDAESRLGFEADPIGFTSNGRALIGAGDRGGTFYAIDPTTMELVFKTDVLPGTSQGGITGLSVDLKNGRIHGTTATPATFFGIDPNTGELLYNHPATAPAVGPPSVASDGVWAADSAGFLSIEDVANGRAIGRLSLGAPSTGGVSFYSRRVYVAIGTTGRGASGGVVAFK